MENIQTKLERIDEINHEATGLENTIEEKVQGERNRLSAIRAERRELLREVENQIFAENAELIEKAEDEFDLELYIAEPDNDDEYRQAIADDGTLHITIGKIRLCFISNQEISDSEWAKQAKPILKSFGFTWSEFSKNNRAPY